MVARPLDSCNACITAGARKIKDDMAAVFEQQEKVDGLILGTPTYFANTTAHAKALIDRTHAAAFLENGRESC